MGCSVQHLVSTRLIFDWVEFGMIEFLVNRNLGSGFALDCPSEFVLKTKQGFEVDFRGLATLFELGFWFSIGILFWICKQECIAVMVNFL